MSTEKGLMDVGNLLSVKEMAERIRMHERTIYRLAKERKIPAFRIGKQWRFDLATLSDWLKKQVIDNPVKINETTENTGSMTE